MSTYPYNIYDFSKVKSIIFPFISEHWPLLNLYIESLFKSFHREAIGRIEYFIQKFETIINIYSPKTLLFSTGTRDVFDCICGYIANQKNIPVIYFQHGGTQIFRYHSYNNYVETDKKINCLGSFS